MAQWSRSVKWEGLRWNGELGFGFYRRGVRRCRFGGRTDLGGQALGLRQRRFRGRCESGDGVDALGGEGGGSDGRFRTTGAQGWRGQGGSGELAWSRWWRGRDRAQRWRQRRPVYAPAPGQGRERDGLARKGKAKGGGGKGALLLPFLGGEAGEARGIGVATLAACGMRRRGHGDAADDSEKGGGLVWRRARTKAVDAAGATVARPQRSAMSGAARGSIGVARSRRGARGKGGRRIQTAAAGIGAEVFGGDSRDVIEFRRLESDLES
uniref:Uncharacterized protein n=1 Tax=Oryza sativa subsp. japonica TaxID=39947 RepID=Q7Y0X6_ORYSJ|nr:hypothetical protein [Oryza sativa Japonica Group]